MKFSQRHHSNCQRTPHLLKANPCCFHNLNQKSAHLTLSCWDRIFLLCFHVILLVSAHFHTPIPAYTTSSATICRMPYAACRTAGSPKQCARKPHHHTATPLHRMAHSFTKKKAKLLHEKRQPFCSGTPAVNIFVHIPAMLLCRYVCASMLAAA